MKYRRFGRTEYKMPVISFGCMRFQSSWNRQDSVKRASLRNLEQIIEQALANGIYHIETARGYGTSEKELGHFIPHLNRQAILLQTKVGPRSSGEEFIRDVRDSMKSLGTDYLDLLAIHGLNSREVFDNAFRKNGPMTGLLRLRDEGVARQIGFSTHAGPKLVSRIVRTGAFDYMNMWYSFIYRDNWPAIMEARRRDMGVFVISPNDKGGKLYSPPHKLRRLASPLTPMQFNDLFILSHRQIHTVSCGAARPTDFAEHIKAVRNMDRLLPQMRAAVARLEKEMRRVLGARWVRHYRDGLPDWDSTPGNLNIPTVLWLWNLARAFDMREYARMRYNLLGNGGHWFPGERVGDLEDDKVRRELSKALRRSPFREEIMDVLKKADRYLKGEEVKRLGRGH